MEEVDIGEQGPRVGPANITPKRGILQVGGLGPQQLSTSLLHRASEKIRRPFLRPACHKLVDVTIRRCERFIRPISACRRVRSRSPTCLCFSMLCYERTSHQIPFHYRNEITTSVLLGKLVWRNKPIFRSSCILRPQDKII